MEHLWNRKGKIWRPGRHNKETSTLKGPSLSTWETKYAWEVETRFMEFFSKEEIKEMEEVEEHVHLQWWDIPNS
jgi:hypothetical protein